MIILIFLPFVGNLFKSTFHGFIKSLSHPQVYSLQVEEEQTGVTDKIVRFFDPFVASVIFIVGKDYKYVDRSFSIIIYITKKGIKSQVYP